jgi:lipoyl(octanoyl) transferase
MDSVSPLSSNFDDLTPAVEFHLLGRVDFDDGLMLQRRLAKEASQRGDGRIDVLLCEHDGPITVGRQGSRLHVRLSGEELDQRGLSLEWVSRSGGCVLHAPGQLAIYPIVPLAFHGWSREQYADRLHAAFSAVLATLSVQAVRKSNRAGLWGRTGQLVALGIAVRRGVAMHGAFVNVCPERREFGYVDTAAADGDERGRAAVMSSLLAEARRPVKMTSVRAALVEQLPQAFGLERYHLHTGHPYLCPLSRLA